MSLGDESTAAEVTARLRAVAHPVRLRMLSLLTGAAMTAADLARELDISHANASYHLRQLHAAGIVTAAGEESIRGGRAKRYRYDMDEADRRDPDGPTGSRPAGAEDEYPALYAALAAEMQRRAALAEPAARHRLTDAELWVDQATWDDVRKRVDDAARDLHLAAKPPHTPGTRRVSATIALFPMRDTT
ncbi:ArsR/SmtB family transcription factor [Allonocardiopsis opalescens]|nr:winged helix-turn-helix domain-containing protein [Allonocardiopsis opalescens]